MTTTGQEAAELIGMQALDARGRRLGRVTEVAMDRKTGELRWLIASRHGRCRALPPHSAIVGTGQVHLPILARQMTCSPVVPSDGRMTATLEADACRAYGLPPTSGAKRSAWDRVPTTVGWRDVPAPVPEHRTGRFTRPQRVALAG